MVETSLALIKSTLKFAANNPKETLMVATALDGAFNEFRVTGHVAGKLTEAGLHVFELAKVPFQVGAVIALLLTGVVVYSLPSKSQRQLEFKASQAERVAFGFGLLASFYLFSRKRKTPE